MSPEPIHTEVIDPRNVHIESSRPVLHLPGKRHMLPGNQVVIGTSELHPDHVSLTPVTTYPTPPEASE